MKIVKASLAALLISVSGLASAEQGSGKKFHEHHHDRFEYARVMNVTPIYREVRISEPVKECWTESVTNHRGHHHQSAGGMLAGGIVGDIIGHHLGQGRKHRSITTAVGTLVGARIGHEAVNGGRKRHHHSDSPVLKETCSHYERVSYQQQIDAYNVTYRYQGRTYQVEMPYDPGQRIKIRIQVTPVI